MTEPSSCFFTAQQCDHDISLLLYLVRALRGNSLSGTIPKSLLRSKSLRRLYVRLSIATCRMDQHSILCCCSVILDGRWPYATNSTITYYHCTMVGMPDHLRVKQPSEIAKKHIVTPILFSQIIIMISSFVLLFQVSQRKQAHRNHRL